MAPGLHDHQGIETFLPNFTSVVRSDRRCPRDCMTIKALKRVIGFVPVTASSLLGPRDCMTIKALKPCDATALCVPFAGSVPGTA